MIFLAAVVSRNSRLTASPLSNFYEGIQTIQAKEWRLAQASEYCHHRVSRDRDGGAWDGA